MLSTDQIRRLRLARLLIHQAVDHARIDYDARTAACVTSLQDAVETLLLIVAEQVNATIPPRTDFDKYFVQINEKLAPNVLPLQAPLMRLNRMRVQAKHAGIFPPHSQVSEMVPVVTAFMSEVCDKHLGINWTTANLSSMVENSEQRSLLEEAEQALASKRYVDALVAARKALYLAFEQTYDISLFESAGPHGLMALGCEAPTWARTPEYVAQNVGDPFGYIVIDHAGLEAKLVKQGIEPIAFWNICRITPAVYRFKDNSWVVKRELAKVERPDGESDTIYVVENVAEIILRKEAQGRRHKLLPSTGPWHLPVKRGAKIYRKADSTSEVRHTFDGGEPVMVQAETCGFDGHFGWWEVFWFGDGAYASGYLLEEDVDRSEISDS